MFISESPIFYVGGRMHRDLKQNLRFAGKAVVRGRRASIGFSAILFVAGVSYGQVDRSGLSGTVTDPSDRMLPRTHVTVVQNATGLHRETDSDASGHYTIPQLPVGIYTVIFAHQGFKKLEFVDVDQVIGRTRTLDATLQVAGSEVRVEVSPTSVLMDRNTS